MVIIRGQSQRLRPEPGSMWRKMWSCQVYQHSAGFWPQWFVSVNGLRRITNYGRAMKATAKSQNFRGTNEVNNLRQHSRKMMPYRKWSHGRLPSSSSTHLLGPSAPKYISKFPPWACSYELSVICRCQTGSGLTQQTGLEVWGRGLQRCPPHQPWT